MWLNEAKEVSHQRARSGDWWSDEADGRTLASPNQLSSDQENAERRPVQKLQSIAKYLPTTFLLDDSHRR